MTNCIDALTASTLEPCYNLSYWYVKWSWPADLVELAKGWGSTFLEMRRSASWSSRPAIYGAGIRCSRKADESARDAPVDRASVKLVCNTNLGRRQRREIELRTDINMTDRATARPAVTAAVPPPTKTSTQPTPTASRARVATLRTPQDAASEASLRPAPFLYSKPGAANQPKRSAPAPRRPGDHPHLQPPDAEKVAAKISRPIFYLTYQ